MSALLPPAYLPPIRRLILEGMVSGASVSAEEIRNGFDNAWSLTAVRGALGQLSISGFIARLPHQDRYVITPIGVNRAGQENPSPPKRVHRKHPKK